MWTLIEKMVATGDGRRGARVRERQGRKRIRPLWSWVKGNRSSLFFNNSRTFLDFYRMKYDKFLNSVLTKILKMKGSFI
jgi:hypothetical protein